MVTHDTPLDVRATDGEPRTARQTRAIAQEGQYTLRQILLI
jgi:hypothetical protein